jgi:hypothetical protein
MKNSKNSSVDAKQFDLSQHNLKWMLTTDDNGDGTVSPHRYYMALFEELPSTTRYLGEHIIAVTLVQLLRKNYNTHIANNTVDNINGRESLFSLLLIFNEYPGYMFYCYCLQNEDEEAPPFAYYGHAQIVLFRPSEDSNRYNPEFEKSIATLVAQCVSKPRVEPSIYTVETNSNGYKIGEHKVSDHFIINNLDVNYGMGFTGFHKELMERFNNSTKGLVLFHGKPGTGKTYYIRHLLRQMADSKKKVLYIPPNMVDYMTSPDLMTFVTKTITEWSKKEVFCVLLIEDAEPLLEKRKEGVRIQGVTNLLNMSDGLLNDILKLQIICTFNVGLRKLDSALLRPGRLLARKEFKALSVLDANLLAQRLGIDHHFDRAATLSEIYSFAKDQYTLTHEGFSDEDDEPNPLDID